MRALLVHYSHHLYGVFMNIKKANSLQSHSMIAGCLLGLALNAYAVDPKCQERHETCPEHYPKKSYSTNYQEMLEKKAPASVAPVIIAAPASVDDDNDGVVNASDQCLATPAGYKVDAKGCPVSLTLHINFAFASNTLPASANSDIETLTKFLQENTASKISIVGHTDSNGIDARNQPRSEARAKALEEKLVAHGIESNRISTSGKGSKEPIASNETDKGRAQNRRIEVIIK